MTTWRPPPSASSPCHGTVDGEAVFRSAAGSPLTSAPGAGGTLDRASLVSALERALLALYDAHEELKGDPVTAELDPLIAKVDELRRRASGGGEVQPTRLW
jgi:hypothetical protein